MRQEYRIGQAVVWHTQEETVCIEAYNAENGRYIISILASDGSLWYATVNPIELCSFEDMYMEAV